MFDVLRQNPVFRRLWLAQVVSLLGDWLNRVAILALIGSLSGPAAMAGVGTLFGIELALRLSPTVVFGGLAGALADRLSRKAILILTDLLRAVVVLGYLLVDERSDLPLLYALMVLQMTAAIFFQAARSAMLPSTVRPGDLHAALTLGAATWSVMLTVGALAGGLLADWAGLRAVFLCDAATYLVSAWLVTGLRVGRGERAREAFRWGEVLFLKDLGRGLRHAHRRGASAAVAAKTFWGPAGVYLALLPLLAARYRSGDGDEDGLAMAGFASATGLFYAARGIGTGLGPVLVRRFWGSSPRVLRRQIAGGFMVAASAYALVPWTEDLWLALFLVMIAHIGGSAIWVGSTTLWQSDVEEAYRGRIFAAEFAGMTGSFAIAGLIGGLAFDASGRLDLILWWTSALVALSGCAWVWFARRTRSNADPAQGAAPLP